MEIKEEQVTNLPEQTKSTLSDMDKLRNNWRFHGVGENEWKTHDELRNLVSKGLHSTVLYPGALSDIQYPLLLTDADKYVFIDPLYAGPNAKTEKETLVESVKEVGHDDSSFILNFIIARPRVIF